MNIDQQALKAEMARVGISHSDIATEILRHTETDDQLAEVLGAILLGLLERRGIELSKCKLCELPETGKP